MYVIGVFLENFGIFIYKEHSLRSGIVVMVVIVLIYIPLSL